MGIKLHGSSGYNVLAGMRVHTNTVSAFFQHIRGRMRGSVHPAMHVSICGMENMSDGMTEGGWCLTKECENKEHVLVPRSFKSKEESDLAPLLRCENGAHVMIQLATEGRALASRYFGEKTKPGGCGVVMTWSTGSKGSWLM